VVVRGCLLPDFNFCLMLPVVRGLGARVWSQGSVRALGKQIHHAIDDSRANHPSVPEIKTCPSDRIQDCFIRPEMESDSHPLGSSGG
jgi:hypothetical protein